MVGCDTCWPGLKRIAFSSRANGDTAGTSFEVSDWSGDSSLVCVPKSRTHVDEIKLQDVVLTIETWPQWRIGSSLWPSGKLLARAFAECHVGLPSVRDLRIIELGAGAGLPGLVCCKLGAASVVLTDQADVLPLINRNITLNNLTGVCHAAELDWSSVASSPVVANGDKELCDILLAADVVYAGALSLVNALQVLMRPKVTKLVLAYKERTQHDRDYLENVILRRLEFCHHKYEAAEHGACSFYVGVLRDDL